jgi:hypothetical protein
MYVPMVTNVSLFRSGDALDFTVWSPIPDQRNTYSQECAVGLRGNMRIPAHQTARLEVQYRATAIWDENLYTATVGLFITTHPH